MVMQARGVLLPAVLALLLALPAPAQAQSAVPATVDGAEISTLVRSTLIALHQANLTGNYSVLRDLGAHRFQLAYTPSSLSDMFRAFRDRQIDLGPAILLDAMLDQPPQLTVDGYLRLVGHLQTAPQQIIFEITFLSEDGRWGVDSLNVGLRTAVAEGPLAPYPVARPTAN